MSTAVAAMAPPTRTLRVRDHEYPVVPPSLRDPRLHVASVIVSVQVLGQVSLGFELSIAQILVSILTCGVLETVITFWRRRAIVWPASALLTGNGVALILRVPGTRHGDWWSLRGAWIFAAVAAVSLLSKYVIRVGGRQLFNPSNLGLVLCFVVLGTTRVNPQDLWWGRMSVGLAVTFTVIVIGGLIVVSRLRMLALALVFWATFAAAVGVVALSGHCISARWHIGPVCGWQFWTVLVTSPEILIFLFFMITDPRTAPMGRVARIVYAASVAFFAALLAAPMRTEFATKVAILGGLTLVCAARPLLERMLPAPDAGTDRFRLWIQDGTAVGAGGPARWERGLGAALVCAGLLAVAGFPARTATTAALPQVSLGQVDGRPDVSLGPGAVPSVTIDGTVHAIRPSFDQSAAQEMGRDLVVDLVIVGDALARRDPKLAATAAAGTWLLGVQERIATARGSTALEVPRFQFDRMTVVLARRTPQSAPQLALAVHGSVRMDVSRGASVRPTRGREIPYARTYVLVPAGHVWLIAADQAPA